MPLARRTELPILRWSVLVALLLAEVLILSIAFDAIVVATDPGWPALVVYRSPYLLRSGMVLLIVVGGLGCWRLKTEIRAAATQSSVREALLWLIPQLLAFGLLALATQNIFARPNRGEPIRAWDLAAWALTGFLTLVLWVAALISPRYWPTLARRGRGVFAVGLLVTIFAIVAAVVLQQGWDNLSRPTLWVSKGLLRLAEDNVVSDPERHLLGTDDFYVTVSASCSGYEGIGLILALLLAYFWIFRHDLRFPQAFLLAPIGIIAIWLANAARIAALIWIGSRVSPELAMGGFHSQAGWLGFVAVSILVIVIGHRCSFCSARSRSTSPALASPTLAYLTPFLLALTLVILAEAFLLEPGTIYPIRAASVAAVLWLFWPRYDWMNAATRYDVRHAIEAVAVGGVVFVFWISLVRFGLAGGESSEALTIPSGLASWMHPLWVAVWIIGYCIMTPLAEELAFRGYLVRRLIDVDFRAVSPHRFTLLSFLVSSIGFGLLHGEWVAGILAGMAYAGMVYRSGHLRDAVIAHSVTNLLMATKVLGTSA